MEYFLSPSEVTCVMDLSTPCIEPKLIGYLFVFWIAATYGIKYGSLWLLRRLYTEIDPYKCYLPTAIPAKKHRGHVEDWTRNVMSVGESELDKFLQFRNVEVMDLSLQKKQYLAAEHALQYRNELFDDAFYHYFEAKFSKGENPPFPVMMSVWNPSNWFGEMGPGFQLNYCGQLAYAFHHAMGGLLAFYCMNFDVSLARLLCYIDTSFNLIDLILMAVSMLTKRDLSIFSGNRRMDVAKGDYTMSGFYVLIVFHHVAASSVEMLALSIGIDPLLIAEGAFAMLGTTAMFHYVCSLSDCMPIRENKFGRLMLNAFTTFVMYYYRGFLWIVRYVPQLLLDTYQKAGIVPASICLVFLLAFTSFNKDFLLLYYGKTKKLYQIYAEDEKIKKHA